MKKNTLGLMAICLTLSFLPLQSNAITHASPSAMVVAEPIGNPEADALVKRLNEIKEMDTSTLTRSEKKALRKETRAIEKNLNQNYGGVYVSVGAAILIIVLLIILL
ncbi:MAG: hypothetical protein K9I85_15505 [Saprospiraceae bacterium]|nr:hypothetical protein [Saprospiraceae bacterium]